MFPKITRMFEISNINLKTRCCSQLSTLKGRRGSYLGVLNGIQGLGL
jgi:hypothetical protein